jgi:hypothetical protein
MKLFFISIFLFFNFLLNAQDIIVKNNSTDTIHCFITKENNQSLYYILPNDTVIHKISHNSYEFYKKGNSQTNQKSSSEQKNSAPAFSMNEPIIKTPFFHIGLGMGLDFGGFGGQLAFTLMHQFKFFVGLGYNMSEDVGANFGIKVNFVTDDKSISPYFGYMYGYNTVVQITASTLLNTSYEYTDVFYGSSFQFGIEFRTQSKRNYFDFSLIVPVRSSDYKNLNVQYTQEPWPVLFSIGFHFGIGKWN